MNRISCPAALFEYLCYGVVPGLISTFVSDFSDFGMRNITLDDLEMGKYPTEGERLEILRNNDECSGRIPELHKTGKAEFLKHFQSDNLQSLEVNCYLTSPEIKERVIFTPYE